MWEKLAWDIDEFQDIQRLAPDEREPLVYSAINVCIAAWSLENWVVATLKARWREEPDKTGPRLTALEAHLRQQIAAIAGQAACSAIANTAKHANYRDAEWHGGQVEVLYHVPDEHQPGGWHLRYRDKETDYLTFSVFDSLKSEWWSLLWANGLTNSERMPTPLWLRNKLRRIFSHLPGEAVPSSL